MDFLSVIIDRIGSTNVFNIVQGRMPSRDTHLKTIVDDDLIIEYLTEIERISSIATSYSDGEDNPVDVSGELSKIGETFFLQFFPEPIQKRLRNTNSGFLFWHIDQSLRNIPWELLYDGSRFLADNYYIGKNISGYWRDNNRPERDRLRVLIIADPTDNLEWARLEGEGLFDSLNAEVSADLLDVQFMAGNRISKLNLLNAIKGRDIIHYTGHVYYSKDQQESGWLLSDNKILRAREIEKSGSAPFLVFSNGCLSAPAEMGFLSEDIQDTGKAAIEKGYRVNDLAGAFLKAGICNYIGTNWEIRDNSRTFDFAMNFYRAIFEEKSVGEALFEARLRARQTYPASDLSWANYVLHGNPMARMFRPGQRRTFDASRNIMTARKIVEGYPTPIAREYNKFKQMDREIDTTQILHVLIGVFVKTMKIIGAITFSNYRHLSLRGDLPDSDSIVSLKNWVDKIYECLTSIRSLRMSISVTGLLEAFFLHRDSIEKLLKWSELFAKGELASEMVETHLITFQYLFDNLLTDLSALSRHKIIYIPENGSESLVLHGTEYEYVRLLPAEYRVTELLEKFKMLSGKICLYSSSRKLLFSMQDFMQFDIDKNKIIFPCPITLGDPAHMEIAR